MKKEREAQQAQTIARIKQEYERHSGRTYHAFTDFAPLVTEFYANLSVLLEIVDSQAQKIAELNPLPWKYCPECGNAESEHAAGFAETHRICRPCMQEWHTDIDYSDTIPKILASQKRKIAEQAKEIEKLNTQIRLMEYRYAEMGDLDYNEPDWLARLKSLSPDGKP